jgi:hypothetical protein
MIVGMWVDPEGASGMIDASTTLSRWVSWTHPAITGSPGFRAVRNLIDRTTGRGLTAIIVSDEDALRAAEVGFQARREKGAAHGIRFGEITHREVVLVDKL